MPSSGSSRLDTLARRVKRLEALIPLDSMRQQWRRMLAAVFADAEYDAIRQALIDDLVESREAIPSAFAISSASAGGDRLAVAVWWPDKRRAPLITRIAGDLADAI